MSGVKPFVGIIYPRLTIFSITKKFRLFVIRDDDFPFDVLLGLDVISSFRLEQDYKLCIHQRPIDEAQHDSSCANVYVPTSNSAISRVNLLATSNDISSPFSSLLSTVQLDESRKVKLGNLLSSFSAAFAKDRYDVGTYTSNEARIILSEHQIIARKPYKCSYNDQLEIKKQVAALLKAGLISESSSPFAAPVTMAFRKSDGAKNRMCIDFRGLNKLVVPETYPFPSIDDIMVKTQGCSWFSALDINSAFWSIPMSKKDRYKTAFVTEEGHWEWNCLPFGIKVASPTYQRILSTVLRKHNLTDFSINYIDDILVFSRSFEEHMVHLQKVFDAILAEGFKFNLKKCSLASCSVQYLGHIIDSEGIRPISDNVISIRDFPTPSTRKNIRQLLGKINFYKKFIPQSALLLEPFHNLLRKDVPFVWSPDCQKAFDQVKKLLLAKPILAIFDRTKPIFIHTDASSLGIGAILKQPQADGTIHPVAYFSKKLTEGQKKRKAVFLECLAVKEAIKHWQYWLMGQRFTVYSDHKPLENLRVSVRPDEELGDMVMYLSQFDFDIVYTPGPENVEADCLSRNPVHEPTPSPLKDIVYTVNFLSMNEILDDQANLPRHPDDHFHDNILYRTLRGRRKIVISTECAKTLIDRVHEQFGHIGSAGLISLISHRIYAENLFRLIREKTKNCEICTKNKSRRPAGLGLMGHFGPAKEPFEIMSLDTIGGFGKASSPKRYLHLLVDHFTRFAYIFTSKTQSSSDFIKLVNKVQANHKIGTLLTDQFGGLSSFEFMKYLDENGINHVFTAVDAAFSNGLNERLNQTITNRIRCRYNSRLPRRSWSIIAEHCVSEYNNTPHSATGFSPNYLLNGVQPLIIPEELMPPSNIDEDRIRAFQSSLHNHEENKRRYDKLRKPYNFSVGDMVYVENGNKLNRNKLDEIRIGPFPIVEKLSQSVFRIQCSNSSHGFRQFHISKMLPYTPPP